MATLTIELPDELAQQVQRRGISQQRLEQALIYLVQELLREWDQQLTTPDAETTSPQPTWSDGEAFARRVIANNRELFEELARL